MKVSRTVPVWRHVVLACALLAVFSVMLLVLMTRLQAQPATAQTMEESSASLPPRQEEGSLDGAELPPMDVLRSDFSRFKGSSFAPVFRTRWEPLMTPEEIAAAETIELWEVRAIWTGGKLNEMINADLHDPDRLVTAMIAACDELVAFVERPDAVESAIDAYERTLAVMHDPERAIEHFGPWFRLRYPDLTENFPAFSAAWAMQSLDRLLASEPMRERSIERADDLFDIFIRRDRILKAVIEETGGDPWNNLQRWQLTQGAFILADNIAPQRIDAWLQRRGTDRRNVMWGNMPGGTDGFWEFIEREFLNK